MNNMDLNRLEPVLPRSCYKIIYNGTWVKIPRGATLHSSKQVARKKLRDFFRYAYVKELFDRLPAEERARYKTCYLHPSYGSWKRKFAAEVRLLEDNRAIQYQDCLESGSGAA